MRFAFVFFMQNIISYFWLSDVSVEVCDSRQERVQGLRYISRMRGRETRESDEEQPLPCVRKEKVNIW